MHNTQKTQVLNHLRQNGSISSWEAIQTYRITRLSEMIRSLRHDDGLNVTDEWRENNGKHFKVYKLEEFKVLPGGQLSIV